MNVNHFFVFSKYSSFGADMWARSHCSVINHTPRSHPDLEILPIPFLLAGEGVRGLLGLFSVLGLMASTWNKHLLST